MERVAFLIEPTGQRIGCLLNPEDLVVRRQAGLVSRRRGAGFLSGSLAMAGGQDDTMLATGGGKTEFDARLLFDVALSDQETGSNDVRDMTGPIWQLCENARQVDGSRAPTVARFIWGKAWNVPVLVLAASERLQRFTASGVPQRSWLRLLLRRVDEPFPTAPTPLPAQALAETEAGSPEGGEAVQLVAVEEGLGRLDLIASALFGDPARWREIAAYNDIDDPHGIDHGRPIRVPPRGGVR